MTCSECKKNDAEFFDLCIDCKAKLFEGGKGNGTEQRKSNKPENRGSGVPS